MIVSTWEDLSSTPNNSEIRLRLYNPIDLTGHILSPFAVRDFNYQGCHFHSIAHLMCFRYAVINDLKSFATSKLLVPWFAGVRCHCAFKQMGRCDRGIAAALLSRTVDALTAHYGSPGRLADYRRQFEKTTRTAGEDPSIFAIALDTLTIKAFGDMGQTAQLCLIRDRFIAGHNNCELRRHLDSVPSETVLLFIVDRCRMWESHADSDNRRVSKPGPDPTFPTYVVSGPIGEWMIYG